MATAADERMLRFFKSQQGEASSPSTLSDVYFSADVETDGPIPGEFSMLSFALVYAGSFDGKTFSRPRSYNMHLYRELKPISKQFQVEALRVNGLDRDRLALEGGDPTESMTDAAAWIQSLAGTARPVLIAYPLSFDWSWLYWYFIRYSKLGSPFSHSSCFDVKTAFSLKAGIPIAASGRSHLFENLRPQRNHSHHALEDAIEQAEIFANIFEWEGVHGRNP